MPTYGKHTYGSIEVHFETDDCRLIVGKYCSIAGNVNAFLNANHRTDWVTTYPFGHIQRNVFRQFNGVGHPTGKGNIVIGNDVWIGSNSSIMSGVTIGDGAVIANGSHVVKDVAPYSIVGGNPAKFIRFRFSPEQIHQLQQIRWWDWDDRKVDKFSPLLCNTNIDGFIEAALRGHV